MKKVFSNIAIAAAAAGAAVAVGENAALAADAIDGVAEPEWFLSLEGGVIFADPATDKLGSDVGSIFSEFVTDEDKFDRDFGYRGAAKFGRKFDDNLDWRLGVAYSNFVKNNSSFIYGGSGFSGSGGAEQETDLSYLTGDLELGYNVRPSDRFDLRMFAGLRVLSSEDSQDKLGELGLGGSGLVFGMDATVESEFLGVGPRVGAEFSGRLSDDSMLGFSGMLAAAVIFGELKQTTKTDFIFLGSGFSGSPETDRSNETVFNLEAAFGADFHLTDNAVLTLGYRGEIIDRYNDKFGEGLGDSSPSGDDFLSHGPFVRLIAEF